MTGNDRAHHVVLLGATGFVGRLTAEHLARSAPDGVRIALAGRSRSRLEAVRDGLERDWPLLVVDVDDEAAVRELAASTTVLTTTVGPYRRHGRQVAHACARAGTSYADLSGESSFVAESVAANHAAAGETGARVVHACGFDSVPSDLATGLAHRAAGGGVLAEATLHVREGRGGVSGGTVDSLRQQLLDARRDDGVRRVIQDPFAFTPGPPVRSPSSDDANIVTRDALTGRWLAPFLMGDFNRQIVQRTNFLTGWGYGPLVRYREVVDTGRGVRGAATAAAVAVGSAAVVGAMSFRPTRGLVDRVLPAPGEGPSDEMLAKGRFAVEADVYPADGGPVRTRFAADLDPGYRGTAVMIGESALSLALDDLPPHAGVLTPMVAMGEALATRLRSHGFRIDTSPLT